MAFLPETNIFTDKGWKEIKDISGTDKVLVRNFVGDAEFIQPFALRSRQYDGDVVYFSARNKNFVVTEDNSLVYGFIRQSPIYEDRKTTAGEFTPDKYSAIYRGFKYTPPKDYTQEVVKSKSGKYSTISNTDWFTLVAYILIRGDIKTYRHYKHITIQLRPDKLEQEIEIIGGILSRSGIDWFLTTVRQRGQHYIRISAKNNLVNVILNRLNADNRKDMYLPDKMIYYGTRELANIFINSLIDATISSDTNRNNYQFVTNNEKLVDTLLQFGTLWGYGMNKKIIARKGDKTGLRVLKKDVYTLVIHPPIKAYIPSSKIKKPYKGTVYEIDLFDGNIYIKGKNVEVWLPPK